MKLRKSRHSISGIGPSVELPYGEWAYMRRYTGKKETPMEIGVDWNMYSEKAKKRSSQPLDSHLN